MNEITIYKTSITLYVQSSHESTDAVNAASTIQSARLLSMPVDLAKTTAHKRRKS